jgi:hypothetical protein
MLSTGKCQKIATLHTLGTVHDYPASDAHIAHLDVVSEHCGEHGGGDGEERGLKMRRTTEESSSECSGGAMVVCAFGAASGGRGGGWAGRVKVMGNGIHKECKRMDVGVSDGEIARTAEMSE